jgi:lysozyme
MSQLAKMITAHEGVETHAYKCTADKITIGVGRNIDPKGGIGLNAREIEMLLLNDIERVEDELSIAFPWTIDLIMHSPARYDALVDICFNLGMPRLRKFEKALQAAYNHNWDEAALEFLDSRWAKQVGYRAVEIAEMIRTGEYQKEY